MYVYQQLEFSDCGYACIRMVCRHYGWRVSPEYLREISDYNRLGLSIGEIRRVLTELGLRCEAVKVRLREVDFMPLPAILYWKGKHFVVLASIRKGKYEILDPAEGRLWISEDEFKEGFISGDDFGIALAMEETPEFMATKKRVGREEKRNGLPKLLKSTFLPNKKSFLCIILFTVMALAADIALPFIFQRTIDEGISSKDVELVWLLVLGQLLVFTGNYVSNVIIELLLTKLGLKISIGMLNEYLSKLVKLPMSFFAKKVSSDLIQKAEDHHRIKNFLLSVPNTLFIAALSIVIFSGLLIVFSPLIFAIFLGFTAVSLLWTTIFLKHRRALDSSLIAKISENRNNLYELIEGIEEIKANNAHTSRVKIWHDLQDKVNKLTVRATFLKFYQGGGNTLLIRLRDIAVMGLCACMVIDGSMTIGGMMTISYIVGRLSVPFSTIFETINEVQNANLSFSRIEEVHNAKIDDARPHGSLETADIALRGVSFKYPGAASKMVLEDVSLTIKRGETTALVGSSGSGKSTIIRLLTKFYLPKSGEITIGDKSLLSIAEAEWSDNVAIVLQNGKIFSGTILSNIALSDEKPDMERVEFAAKVACIDDFINSYPLKFNTRIGKTGLDLSGGQQQRILLARAVYRDPQILILDEATSSMDAITESRIMANIYEAFRGRTLIIAAHRLSTIRDADTIYVIENGRVAESGNHEELLANRGEYFRLVNRQI